MPFPAFQRHDFSDARSSFDAEDSLVHRDALKSIIAGARARGVADGLEMLGLGAVLLDVTGGVLHVGGRGRRMMGGWAKVVENHLIAERPADNRSVQDLIGSVVGAARHDPETRIHIVASDGGAEITVRALRFDTEEGPVQRLHAVLVLEDGGPVAERAVSPCGEPQND